MTAEYPGQDDNVVRSIARRQNWFAGAAALAVVAMAASGGLLSGAMPAVLGLAVAIAIVIAATGAWLARVTTAALQVRADELARTTHRLSSSEATAEALRRRALASMADRIERESGIVIARLANQARSKGGDGVIDDLLRQAREGIVRAVRTANGDIERRRWTRMQLAGSVEIEIAGDRATAPIIDVSAGGVRVGGELAADVGATCRVRLPGVGPELPATILALSPGEARLRFDIDEITRAVVNRMLESASQERAVAA